jgi:hypothetical protein
MSLSPVSYSKALQQRSEAMRLARNAAFYLEHSTRGNAHNVWRALVQQRVREARAANRIVVARAREWSAGPLRLSGNMVACDSADL